MTIFGNKSEFAIEWKLYSEIYPDDLDIVENPNEYLLGGRVFFWLKNKNLFAFKDWGADATYEYYTLEYLIDFLSDHLLEHMTEAPFPVETKTQNATDMIEETAPVKIGTEIENELEAYLKFDWSSVDMTVMQKIDEWIYPRSLLANRGGTFLPNLIIRRLLDNIEISWDNRHPHDDGENKFYMLHDKGVEYVNVFTYREVVTQFCLAYIDRIKEKEPKLAETYRKNLRKAMRAPI